MGITRYIIACLLHLAFAFSISTEGCLPIVWIALGHRREKISSTVQSISGCLNRLGLIAMPFFGAIFSKGVPNSAQLHAKKYLLVGMLIMAIVGLLMPPALLFAEWSTAILYLIQGICHVLIYATVLSVQVQWVPENENTLLFGITAAALLSGRVLALSLSPVLVEHVHMISPHILYSCCSLLVALVLLVYLTDAPELHRFISQEEIDYIKKNRPDTIEDNITAATEADLSKELLEEEDEKKKNCCKPCSSSSTQIRELCANVPWMKVFQSGGVWGYLALKASRGISMVVLSFVAIKLLTEVKHMNMSKAGVYCGMQFVVAGIITVASGSLVDVLRAREFWTTNTARKTMVSVGHTAEVAGLILLIFINNSDEASGGLCLLVATGMGLSEASVSANAHDLAPNFMPVLGGLGAASNGLTSAIVVAGVQQLNRHSPLVEWQAMLFVLAGTKLLIVAVFWSCGSTDVQSWNNMDSEEINKTEKQDADDYEPLEPAN